MYLIRVSSTVLAFSSIFLSSCSLLDKNKGYSDPIQVPDLHLNYFSGSRKNTLINYFINSAEWHVAPINGTVIAVKRKYTKAVCNPIRIPLRSSYPNGQAPYPSISFFNFHPNISEPSNEKVLESRSSENNTTSIQTATSSYDGYISSHLIIESEDKNLRLHVFESSKDIKRQATSKYLSEVSNQLTTLINSQSELDEKNSLSILPPGSIRKPSQQTVLIQPSEGGSPGDYTISGHINPGEEGFIYLKVLVKSRGSEMVSLPEMPNAEYTGWSKDPNEKFNFCLGALLVATEKDGSKVLSEFQLWFHPSNGSSERILNKQTLLVNVSLK
jgi:hypothetical protein